MGKDFIEFLSKKNSNYNDPEQAINQANSLESLSKDIYTDSQRFIYELLQNADDASNQNRILDIRLDFIENYAIISHKGEAFSEIDIESISSTGDGTKAGDSNKTGFKGIGFKSVFSHSNFVIIKSGEFCFRFDKQHWSNHWNDAWGNAGDWKAVRKSKKKDDNLKMPWQIIPVWTDLPSELNNLASIFQEYNVSTIIRYDKIEQLKRDLNDLFSKSQIILFLRSKHVKVSINANEQVILEKYLQGESTVLKRNGEILSEWLINTEQFEIPLDVIDEIRADDKSPKKLKDTLHTEISFAIQLEKGRLKVVDEDNRLIFTYLPTSINYSFPFLVNASFLTDAGREHLHKDTFWNNWLFKQIPIRFFSWLARLAHKDSKFSKQILTVIPHQLGMGALEKSFNEGFNVALDTIPFIPNRDGNLLKVKEVIFDKSNISDFINPSILINYINQTKNKGFTISSFVSSLESKSTLSKLGVEMFDIDELDGFFASQIFSNEHKLDENFGLISFLHGQIQNNRSTEHKNMWNEKLRQTAFIFDEEEQLQRPSHIYFPSVEISNDFSDDISIIHESIVTQINANSGIKDWLEDLGVEEPSDISFIEKTIIGQSDSFVTKNNAIKVGRYLFNAHKKGDLQEKHYENLKKLYLLTKESSLIKASNAHLSNFYEPELRLEEAYQNDFYVSENYLENKDLKSEWKTFFIKIGVNETIKWISSIVKWSFLSDRIDYLYFSERTRDTTPYESSSGNRYYISFTEYKIHHFSHVLLATNYNFSKIFWSVLVDKDIASKSSHDYGYGKRGWIDDMASLDKPYSEWLMENLALIPTTQQKCLKASEVYSNAIPQIFELAGKYLPIFDYNGTISTQWKEYFNFKETIGITEYLSILRSMWQDINLDEAQHKINQKRINLIYEKLSLLNLHTSEKEKIKAWSESNKLLAKNGKDFYYPHELSIITVDGFKDSTLAFGDEKNPKIIELLRLFGVKIIDEVTPAISNSTVEITEFKTKLQQITPLIALVAVEKSKNRKEWENEYERIKQKLIGIHFFETTEIYLSYGNEEDKQKRSSWAKGNDFYYVGKWYSPRVLDGLIEPLGKFLNIRYSERTLTVLLLETFTSGVEYLQEKGFDISLIPDELLNPKEPETRVINQNISDYNVSDEDLGKKGEKVVYEKLKEIYTQKYAQPIEETMTGFKVGSRVEVFWRNISENTTANHDFKVLEQDKEIYIDSKATPYGKNIEKVALYISGNELELMEKAEKYLIARVYNAVSDSPSIEFVRLTTDSI